jgi:hypothetical protein
MGGEAEVKRLKRQNRRLKVALFTLMMIIVAGFVASSFVGVRIRQRVRAEAERARAEAVRAVLIAEAAREEAESRNAVEPGS